MGKIVAISNQKGGVGKTTSCVNLAASMAATKRKVLVIDLDPQGNATMASGIDKYQVEATSYDLLVENVPFDDVVCKKTSGHYHLIAANGDVTAAEIKLMEVFAREVRLKNAIAAVRDNYDFIFIDCPPSLNLLTINAMVAADSVLIPMQCEYFALEGLGKLLNTIKSIQNIHNPELDIEGLLLTMFDSRLRLSNQVVEEVKKHFQDMVFKTVIQRNVRLSEAPSYGESIIAYDATSRGAVNYINLANEILKNHNKDGKSN